MKEKYNALFDKLAPQRSDDELLRAVLDRKAVNMSDSKEKKKLGRKFAIIPAVAAAMMICTTVGVAAANEWNIPAALGSLFDKSPKTSDGESEFEFGDFDFNEFGGKVLDQRYERDGYAVQMRGVVADMHSALIFYDVILDEGHIFTIPLDNGEVFEYTYTEGDEVYVTMWQESFSDLSNKYIDQIWNIDDSFDFDEFKKVFVKMDYHYENIMLEKEGNIFHCVHREDMKILSYKDEELDYKIMGLHAGTPDCAYNDDLNEDILPIKFDFVRENDEITVDGNAPFSISSGENGAVTSVHMTSLAIDLYVEWENGPLGLPSPDVVDDPEKAQIYKDEMNKVYPEIRVRFKDGTVADNNILSWDSERYSSGYGIDGQNRVTIQNLLLHWKYPVKVEDIDAIIIGDGEFKIN
ncbi:MAG: DUF4179 domain-containing protein [Ruminococcaceae bacterium]|nr:DUF4179 domain-containing protein [Oscillospiraceae bacterium]